MKLTRKHTILLVNTHFTRNIFYYFRGIIMLNRRLIPSLLLCCGLPVLGIFVTYLLVTTTSKEPMVTITADQNSVLTQARAQAAQLSDMPFITAYSGVIFDTDYKAKTFLERIDNLPDISNYYSLYTWKVRLFNPGKEHEITYIFLPNGTPWGFVELIPETFPGAALSETEAKEHAEIYALDTWHIDLRTASYKSHQSIKQKNGRIDHTFVYELQALEQNGGVRVEVKIAGDTVVSLVRFIEIPESFTRTYEEHRSLNGLLGFLAFIWMLLTICICVYLRKDMAASLVTAKLIDTTTYIGAGFSGISLLTVFNQFHELLTRYPTILTVDIFMMIAVLFSFLLFVVSTIFYTLLIRMVGAINTDILGYNRVNAFMNDDHHSLLPSPLFVTRMKWMYGIVPIWLGITTAFYVIMTTWYGWWSPENLIANPNILAHYVTWLNPLFISVHAGFTEECIFRIIPLATVLYCTRNNLYARKWLIPLTIIIQSLAFGAAHAHYPMEPFYARILELFLPSVMLSYLMLRWGWIWPIIIHSLYDFYLFALPIIHTNGYYGSKVMIIVISGMPLLLVSLYVSIKQATPE